MRAVGMMVVTTFQHVACTMLHFAPCKTSGTRSVGGPSLLVHLGVCFLTGTSWVAFFWMRGKACAASKTLCVVLLHCQRQWVPVEMPSVCGSSSMACAEVGVPSRVCGIVHEGGSLSTAEGREHCKQPVGEFGCQWSPRWLGG